MTIVAERDELAPRRDYALKVRRALGAAGVSGREFCERFGVDVAQFDHVVHQGESGPETRARIDAGLAELEASK